jgi:uncharacterized protein YjdB
MIKLFWSGLLTVLLLSGCGWDGTASRPNDFTTLTSIQIVPASTTIAAGTSTKLTVIGSYSGQFTRDVTDQATWSSDDTAVAGFITASSPSRVTGVAKGSAILKATVGGLSATSSLTVSNATIQTVTVTPASATVPSGLTTQFTASGTFLDGTTITTQDLTFDATWTSSTPAVATVSDLPASKGLAQGLTVGTSTINATFGAVPVSGTATLTVTAAVLRSITVTPPNSTVTGFSKTVDFIATGNFSDGTSAPVTSTAAWSSSAVGVATIVASSGLATTVAAGTTIISATLNGVTGITNLTVTAPTLIANGLAITPAGPIFLAINASQQLVVTATFSDGSTQNVAIGSAWTSSVPTITSVNTTGLITGVSVGVATITAQYLGQSVSTTVTVQ